MAGILFKIAKEFNVGTSTIVDFLISKGYDITNKPNAKVSDEMHDALRVEYQGSAAIKEKADQLQIGSTYKKKEEKQEVAPPPPPPAPTPEAEETKPEPVVEEEKPSESPAPPAPETEKPSEDSKSSVGLKVLGKIDLDKGKKDKEKRQKEKKEQEAKAKQEALEAEKTAKAKREAEEAKAKEEQEKAAAKAKKETPEVKVEKTGDKAPAEAATPTNHDDPNAVTGDAFRAKTPQLKGLKILGKIDTSKLKPAKKTKTEKTDNKSGTGDRTKRRRTRKKINPNRASNNSRGAKKQKKDEIKEVSQKEIDDKIKATMARMAGGKNKRQKIRRDNRETKREKEEITQLEQEAQESKLKLSEFVSVSELASLMDVNVTEVITTCMNLGVIVSINQRLDAEIIELVAGEFNYEVEFVTVEEDMEEEEEVVDDPADLEPRAPIVTVMGHVDHGKTSLLDFIRKAKVADGEAGGITQHIGAYEVKVNDQKITFLDTPGHEAFTAMRARGAKVTDVAVVIIAADDNIMPQTKEAISHAQAAGVPIVFAINKIDKDGADPNRIKQELASMNLLVEEWGGTFQSQDISAKSGLNIDLLLEKILLEAEVLELQANPSRDALGTVIEASLDKGRGYVTKILVQNGTLEIGDPIACGSHSGKIKAMFNEKGKRVKKAGPSTPVLILGLSGAPQAGEKFKVMESEQEARQIATKRSQIEREQTNRAAKRISLDEIGRRLALGTFKELNLIVKGDVDGSIEALADSLIKLSVETIQVNVIHKAVGQIVESDVLLASASDAIVIGFQVRPSSGARNLAEKEGVEIKTYSIIYQAIEEIKAAMEGMLEAKKEENIIGQVEVRETYKISKVGTVAGCYVTEGKVMRNSNIRLVRDGIVVYPTKENQVGELSSLKRFKDDAKEVKFGMECGLTIRNYNDIKVGDVIEVYEIVEVKQFLD